MKIIKNTYDFSYRKFRRLIFGFNLDKIRIVLFYFENL